MNPEDKVKVIDALENICEVYAPHNGSESVMADMGIPDYEVLKRWRAIREVLVILRN